MCPIAQADGHDCPRLVDEAVPGKAAVIDDVVIGLEDAVGEPVVADELPNVFDRVELGLSIQNPLPIPPVSVSTPGSVGIAVTSGDARPGDATPGSTAAAASTLPDE